MKVLKFGGTSVGSPEAVHALVTIAKDSGERVFVVSAFSGITDSLLQARSVRVREGNGDSFLRQ